MEIISHPSPNFDERKLPVSLLVMHYTGMKTGQEALQRLCDSEAKVSAHYVIEENGQIFQLVEESERAWHAGLGYWNGITDVNSASIGIEIVNPGHEWGYRAFPETQMQSVINLSKEIISRHAIAPHNVIGHSDIAPERKQDPGELFDWERLAEQGIGLYPEPPQNLDEARDYTDLSDYGYSLDNPQKTIEAFQRHFRPAKINGKWDDDCATRLASLLKKR